AVFVFGIMLGNKDSFGFKMGGAESQRLDQYVETTPFIMRLFIFILLGSQVDFALMNQSGVIPAALAGILLGMKAPGAQMIASLTFIAILMTILIQAPTTRWLGGKLALLEETS